MNAKLHSIRAGSAGNAGDLRDAGESLASAIPCEECAERQASWAIDVMGLHGRGTRRYLACEKCACWYLAQPRDIYPAERLLV